MRHGYQPKPRERNAPTQIESVGLRGSLRGETLHGVNGVTFCPPHREGPPGAVMGACLCRALQALAVHHVQARVPSRLFNGFRT
jgi:hypothetical protein